ncbi:gamma-crystallin M3-like [Stegastes partitus]|uniref:Gamma-crystallin M3-like n=1 Tax=Stegastes partitus TaxID=144197 RepID=A0A9Y4KP38_9TELE|nr:PREDICTED: gamma-crystallin M3-like [Stegastes partitus]
MGRIIFYEDRNFQGRHYETSSDCPELTSYLSRCHSIRVESGCFMVYDRPNFMGNQFLMRRGEYADYMSMNMTTSIENKIFKQHNGKRRIIFYEDRNFQGRSYECMSDCPDMSSYLSRCHSCRVESGCFMVYERPNFMGNQYFMRRGEAHERATMVKLLNRAEVQVQSVWSGLDQVS